MDLWPVTILRWFLHPRSTCNFLTLRDSSLELWPVTILWCFFHARSTCPATFKWFTSKTNVLVTWSKRLLIIALCFSWRAQTQLGTIKAFRYLRRPDTGYNEVVEMVFSLLFSAPVLNLWVSAVLCAHKSDSPPLLFLVLSSEISSLCDINPIHLNN